MERAAIVRSVRPLVVALWAENLADETASVLRNTLLEVQMQSHRVTIRYDSGASSRQIDDFGVRFAFFDDPPDDSRVLDLPESYEKSSNDFESWLSLLLSSNPNLGLTEPVAALLAVPAGENAAQQVLELSSQLNSSQPMLKYVWVLDDSSEKNGKETLDAVRAQFGVHCALVDISSRANSAEAVREMLSASVIPFMEQCVSAWQHPTPGTDRNRPSALGLGSRLMNMSRRLLSNQSGSAPPKPEHDIVTGVLSVVQRFPLVGSPLAGSGSPHFDADTQMRRLATFALLLRDFPLSAAAHDALRKQQDQPWPVMAATQELAVASSLLSPGPHPPSPKTVTMGLEPMVDSAVYTWLSRCNQPVNSLRCCLVCAELLVDRTSGKQGITAARWLAKVLEVPVLAPARPMVMLRIGHAYERKGWLRKARLWKLLAEQHSPVNVSA